MYRWENSIEEGRLKRQKHTQGKPSSKKQNTAVGNGTTPSSSICSSSFHSSSIYSSEQPELSDEGCIEGCIGAAAAPRYQSTVPGRRAKALGLDPTAPKYQCTGPSKQASKGTRTGSKTHRTGPSRQANALGKKSPCQERLHGDTRPDRKTRTEPKPARPQGEVW